MEHPAREDIELVDVLAAIGHPVRVEIVRKLAAAPPGERACGEIMPHLPKSTMTSHWRVLTESGIIHQRHQGRNLLIRLRREDLEARFPGLLGLVTSEGSHQTR